jgi:hypothetical protein
MNTALYQLLNSFPALYVGENVSQGRNYELIIGDFSGVNNVTIPITSPTGTIASVVFQEYSTVGLWSPVSSLVFTSNLIPVSYTSLTAPLLFNDNLQVLSLSGNNANIVSEITDISAAGQDYKPSILYNPSGEYRMLSMTGSQPLRDIDISVFFKQKNGVFTPLRLQSGGSCTLKIYFRRKIGYRLLDMKENK